MCGGMARRVDTLVLAPKQEQIQLLRRHAGARRFAYNACVANVNALRTHKDEATRPKLPWSTFDNINYFNAFKHSTNAGVAEDGTPGLPWAREVSQQVFEEGAKDFGLAMTAWGKYCKARKQAKAQKKKAPRKVGPPQFSTRRSGKATFRFRNNVKRTTLSLSPEGLRVPSLGLIPIRGSTSKVRRRLRQRQDPSKTAYITQVTFKFDETKQLWFASLAITWAPAPAQFEVTDKVLGCDVGIKSLVAMADEDGGHEDFGLQPKAVARSFKRTKRAQRHLGLKRFASEKKQTTQGALHRTVSNSEKRALRKLRLRHARIKNIRRHAMHELTNRVVQTHGRICIEGLQIAGMLKNHCLAGAIARQAWGEFFWQVQYKSAWRGGVVVVASPFFPSTKRCSQCGALKAMPLDERTYRCDTCPWVYNRDVNSAINLAWYAQQSELVHEKYSVQHVKKAGTGTGREPSRGDSGLCPTTPSRALRSRDGIGRMSRRGTTGSPEKGSVTLI
jgi:putative transposase